MSRTSLSVCTVDGCKRPYSAKGFCKTHYQRKYMSERLAVDDEFHLRELNRQREYMRRSRLGWTEEERLADNERQRIRGTGWSEAAVSEALERQQGLCEICPRKLDRTDRKTGCCGDHYETLNGVRVRTTRQAAHKKHPRALLCQACNSGLGHYEGQTGQRAAGLRIAQYEEYIAKYGG